jgi:hypothetical protein
LTTIQGITKFAREFISMDFLSKMSPSDVLVPILRILKIICRFGQAGHIQKAIEFSFPTRLQFSGDQIPETRDHLIIQRSRHQQFFGTKGQVQFFGDNFSSSMPEQKSNKYLSALGRWHSSKILFKSVDQANTG